MKIYFDFRDWRVGLYIAEDYYYFCVITLVLRIKRANVKKPKWVFLKVGETARPGDQFLTGGTIWKEVTSEEFRVGFTRTFRRRIN